MRRSLLIGTASLLNVILAVLFHWVLLTTLGPGRHSDALFAALTIPQLFATVIASGLTQVLVPLLAGESEDDARRTVWSCVALLGPLFTGAAALLALSAQWWAPLLIGGFDTATKMETVRLTQISVFGILFTGATAVQQAAAFARGHYIWPDIAQAVANAVALVLLWWLLPDYGVIAAAWITLGRLILQSLLMLNEFGRFVKPDLSNPALLLGWNRLKSLILGTSYYKLDPLIDRFLLSTLAPGSLSFYTLAQQLYGAASQVTTKALVTPVQTRMATLAKRGQLSEFAYLLRHRFIVVSLFCLICVGGLALVGQSLLSLALAHGRFDASHVHELWRIMLLASGIFIFGASGSLLAGSFYARGDTRTPTLIGSASFTIAIALKLAMFGYLGVEGVSLAMTIQYVLSALMMVIWLQRKSIVNWTDRKVIL
jgi:putative peptidoglycan lipid II flippase